MNFHCYDWNCVEKRAMKWKIESTYKKTTDKKFMNFISMIEIVSKKNAMKWKIESTYKITTDKIFMDLISKIEILSKKKNILQSNKKIIFDIETKE